MEPLPPLLCSALAESYVGAVQDWWERLREPDRAALVSAYDERQEECFFGFAQDWGSARRVFGGRFLPTDDVSRFDEWEADWREFLVEHPEASLATRCRNSSWLTLDGHIRIYIE